MLRVDPVNDYIYITKGDTGTLEVTLTGNDIDSDGTLEFNIYYTNSMEIVDSDPIPCENVEDNQNPTNTWKIMFGPQHTSGLNRGKYYYDIKYKGTDKGSPVVNTFIGGDTQKVVFMVT